MAGGRWPVAGGRWPVAGGQCILHSTNRFKFYSVQFLYDTKALLYLCIVTALNSVCVVRNVKVSHPYIYTTGCFTSLLVMTKYSLE